MAEEPNRIGLTDETRIALKEMIDDGVALQLWDLYRLAVAIGVREGKKPPPLNNRVVDIFRTNELDPDGALYTAVEASDLYDEGEAIYSCIERLAEQGIKEFYELYRRRGELPFGEILGTR